MAIRKIIQMGNPILRNVAAVIDNPRSDDIVQLSEDLKDTLVDINGRGIAAPQISSSCRLVVYRLPADHMPAGSETEPVPWTALVNPVIEPLSDKTQIIWERCLSLPGLFGKVTRHQDIRIKFDTLDGEKKERIAHGFHSMLLQHECDHLDGVLYPMRIKDMKNEFAFASELGNLEHFDYSKEEFDGKLMD